MAPTYVRLPEQFSHRNREATDFDRVLRCLEWSPQGPLVVDLTSCESANFQDLVLLIQYSWHMVLAGADVSFRYGLGPRSATAMLQKMGAQEWREILTDEGRDFDGGAGPQRTFALRRGSEIQNLITRARRDFQIRAVQFPDYLSYIISELLYNATEHGVRSADLESCRIAVPAIFQFGYYPQHERLSIIASDIGQGIKSHLEQAYGPFETDQQAILEALKPGVSGTFGARRGPYSSPNNAGMGLTISSEALRRVRGDMWIVSGTGCVHVSPEDVTSKRLPSRWPGTFVLVEIKLGSAQHVSINDIRQAYATRAVQEIENANRIESTTIFPISVFNYFGKYAEDKDAAIRFRERQIIPAVESGKRIELDFRDVETAPHSFLNALLSEPIRRLGPKAYQSIKIYNAPGEIHEIIAAILDANTERIK